MKTNLTSRGKKILYYICNATSSITINSIADKLEVSSRTILRELPLIEQWLREYNVELIKKPKIGIVLMISELERINLKNLLETETEDKIFTIEERQNLIINELLLLIEPKKLYYFSSLFDVSESTISSDLNKIEYWLNENNLKLIKKPGFGVFIDGDEKNFRKCISKFIYENLSDNQILSLPKNQNSKNICNDYLLNTANKNLLNLIDISIIQKICSLLTSIENIYDFKFAERNFVSLIIHLTISVLRVQRNKFLGQNEFNIYEFKETTEYKIANQISLEINKLFNINLPENEIFYISMHLKSAKITHNANLFGENIFKTNIKNKELKDLIYKIILIIEKDFKIKISNDEILISDLIQHLRPAINRIKLGFDIKNPLLEDIKHNYPVVYNTGIKCMNVINKFFNIKMPDDEIGFIALHIGAALERKKSLAFKKLRVAVSCPSGIGTSRFLATRITREFSDLVIVDVLSSMDINENWIKENNIDFIISTVKIKTASIPHIVTNPLLLEKDKKNIDSIIHNLKYKDNYDIHFK
ncbi:MAG: transcription antiterminator [Clostridiales bacterium]